MTKNLALLSRFYIRVMDYCRNILRLKEILGKKLRATGRDLLSKEEISYDRKKFPVTGRNVLSQEEISSDRTKFQLKERNSLSHEEIPVAE